MRRSVCLKHATDVWDDHRGVNFRPKVSWVTTPEGFQWFSVDRMNEALYIALLFWFSRRNVTRQERPVCFYCFQRDLWPQPSGSTLLLWRRKKASFIWRTLTHTAVHETCYHRQRSTGNAVYHFLSVIVCLGLRCVIRLQKRERESDASEENTHRSCYQPPHMSVCTKTRSIRRRQICLLVLFE